MSSALSYTYADNELAQGSGAGLSTGLEPSLALADSSAARDDVSLQCALNPGAFLHQAMQSTRNLLALSTVARLIMDKERREGVNNVDAPPACTPECCRDAGFFSSLRQKQPTDSNAAHLQCRIQELEVSLKRIAVSDLPEVTKNCVRQRMLEQMTLLRAYNRALHSLTME